MKILETLTLLSNSPKRNDKISILRENKENKTLERVVYHALNPYIQFYIRKIPSYSHLTSTISVDDFIDNLSKFSERKITGNAAIAELSRLLSNMDPSDAKVAELIIKKDLRCGVAAATANSVWKNIAPKYPCLLGNAFSEDIKKHITFPAYSQLKLDGMRVNFIVDCDLSTVNVFGRSGKPIDLLNVLDDAILSLGCRQGGRFVLDGELTVVDNNGKVLPRKSGNGILNKAIAGTISESEAKRVRVTLWDFIPLEDFKQRSYKVPYYQRYTTLSLLFHHVIDHRIKMVPTKIVNSWDEAINEFQLALSQGEEGTMLKTSDHYWEDKRSNHLVKFKSILECELKVTSIVPGTGKYEGLIGAIICESDDGLLSVSVGSGFSDEQRSTLSSKDLVGRIVTVRYNEVITDVNGLYSLFLPRLVEIREDKESADTLQTIKN